MEKQSLALSFCDTLESDVIDQIGEFAELGIDAIMDEGILKNVPIVSTAIALYRIGNSIRERHSIKKLAIFIQQIHHACLDEAKRQEYRQNFVSDEKFRSQELEYILILIDRYLGFEKPRLLAKLYLAYLDGIIIWQEFTMYAEVIDRFLLLDCSTLVSDASEVIVPRNMGEESVLRLVALGLMTEETDYSTYKQEPDGNLRITYATLMRPISPNRVYRRTEFGEKLASILR